MRWRRFRMRNAKRSINTSAGWNNPLQSPARSDNVCMMFRCSTFSSELSRMPEPVLCLQRLKPIIGSRWLSLATSSTVPYRPYRRPLFSCMERTIRIDCMLQLLVVYTQCELAQTIKILIRMTTSLAIISNDVSNILMFNCTYARLVINVININSFRNPLIFLIFIRWYPYTSHPTSEV